VITAGRLLGIVLILSGGALYTYAKDKEMQAAPANKPTYIPMTQQDIDEEETGIDLESHKVGKASA